MYNFSQVVNVKLKDKTKKEFIKVIWKQSMRKYNIKYTFFWISSSGYLRWFEYGINNPDKYAKAKKVFWKRFHKKAKVEISCLYVLDNGQQVSPFSVLTQEELDRLRSLANQGRLL